MVYKLMIRSACPRKSLSSIFEYQGGAVRHEERNVVDKFVEGAGGCMLRREEKRATPAAHVTDAGQPTI